MRLWERRIRFLLVAAVLSVLFCLTAFAQAPAAAPPAAPATQATPAPTPAPAAPAPAMDVPLDVKAAAPPSAETTGRE